MARVTVEDCILKVPNRFNLVLLAGQRARAISSGVTLTVARDNDKNPVVALREIAEGTVGIEHLRNSLIQSMQKHVNQDEPEEEIDVLLPEIDFISDLGEDAAEDVVLDEEIAEGNLNLQEDVVALEAEAESVAVEALQQDKGSDESERGDEGYV